MTAHCYLCAEALDAAPVVHDRGRHRPDWPMLTVACERCGLVQHAEHPTSAEIDEYYTSGAYRREFVTLPCGNLQPGTPAFLRARAAWADAQVDRYLVEFQGIKGATVFEVGAGDCSLTKAFRRRGVRAVAIERDPTIVPSDVAVLRDLPDTFPDGQSLVLAQQVLEHAHDPIDTLRGWLRAGSAYVEVPNARAPYGPGLGHFLQWPHVVTFSPATLAICALMAGAAECVTGENSTILCGFFSGLGPRRSYQEAARHVAVIPSGHEEAARLRAWHEQATKGAA